MKKLTFLLVVTLTTVFIGCDSGAGSSNNNNNNGTDTTSSAPVTTPGDQAATPPAQDINVQSTPVEGAATPAPTGDAKLNPPHGEPGHRCDIAVGAPLPM